MIWINLHGTTKFMKWSTGYRTADDSLVSEDTVTFRGNQLVERVTTYNSR
jgi:hypothetical protein